jgi:hypothetical protein
VWLVVAVMAMSLILNLITPSTGGRALWAPVLVVLLTSSLVVEIGVLRGVKARAERLAKRAVETPIR